MKLYLTRRLVMRTRLTSGLLALVVLVLLPFGCDSSSLDEEEVLIIRVELRLLRTDGAEPVVASVQGDEGLMAGAPTVADTLRLVSGATYEGRVEMFDATGQDITGQVRQEAENHQLFYTLEGTNGIGVVVTDVESDYGRNEFGGDLRVGLAYRVTVSEDAPDGDNGRLRLQVGQFGPGRKNGSTLTVEPIVDVRLPILVAAPPTPPGPGDPEPITRAVLRLVRTDGAETWTVTAEGNINVNEDTVPSSLQIDLCTTDASGTTICGEENDLILRAGDYEGQWELFDEATGARLNDEITAEADWHQFFYRVNFGIIPFTFQDTDSNGLRLGLSFLLSVPETVLILRGSFRVTLGHFDPTLGDVKDGQSSSTQHDMRFRMPMLVQHNGPPEPITRTLLTLQRADALETITLTAAGDSLRILGAEPDSLVVETCTGPVGQQDCSTGRSLTLTRGATYTGTVELFNDVTGEPVMDEIMNEALWHQFFYEGDLADAFTVTDTDVNGLPLGFNFLVAVPANASSDEGTLQIILAHYGRVGFTDGNISSERDLDFSVSLSVP